MTGRTSPARAARLLVALRADRVAARLFPALAAEGIDVLLLRGPVIAHHLYEGSERGYGDCDLLVRPEQRARLVSVLERLGFEPYAPDWHAQHWRCGDSEIDVHTTLLGVHAPPETLWRELAGHRLDLEVCGVPVAAVDGPATALVVALHVAQHGSMTQNPMADLERALGRLGDDDWRQAAALAAETRSLAAFRQGLTMVPAGRARLAALGLEPAVTIRSALRQRGFGVPPYLFEGLTVGQRLVLFGRRIVPSRAEMAGSFDARAAASTPWLIAAHGKRAARLPLRYARLAAASLAARRETTPGSR